MPHPFPFVPQKTLGAILRKGDAEFVVWMDDGSVESSSDGAASEEELAELRGHAKTPQESKFLVRIQSGRYLSPYSKRPHPRGGEPKTSRVQTESKRHFQFKQQARAHGRLMPRLEFFLVAEDVAIDQVTNRLSLFNVVKN